MQQIDKKRKDCTFRRLFNETPSVILGCPGMQQVMSSCMSCAFKTSASTPVLLLLPEAKIGLELCMTTLL